MKREQYAYRKEQDLCVTALMIYALRDFCAKQSSLQDINYSFLFLCSVILFDFCTLFISVLSIMFASIYNLYINLTQYIVEFMF